MKVSVLMITYGHDKYITEAIEGVLEQNTNFDFELIISNDFSPDETEKKIIQIIQTHTKGSKIKYKSHSKNIGMQLNFISAYKECAGEYIALCEGDDYWTDPLKLQKQVDFLEANSDYVLCSHKVDILKLDGEIVEDFITVVPDNYETIESLATFGNFMHTPSVVFRNVIKEFPFEFQLSPIGDYFLYIMLAEHGKIKYLNDKMAIYRFESGIYSRLEDNEKNKKWKRTLIYILSYSKNDTVKSIILSNIFKLSNLNDVIEIKIKPSFKKKIIKNIKLFIPPFFLVLKRKIFSLGDASK